MIKQLHISNYALIDRLDIQFADGLTIITGETGAGKSIILGALALILGERADSKAIRDSNAKTIVEATFDIGGYHLDTLFKDNDIDWDEHDCLVRREISPNGRSRAFINDTPVQLNVLRELSTSLLDIHSQHSNMLLSQPAFQLSILDNIAGNGQLLEHYGLLYHDYRDALPVLGRTAHHRGSSDVYVLDGILHRDIGLGYGLAEGIEVHADKVYRAYPVLFQLTHVVRKVPTGKKGPVNLRM